MAENLQLLRSKVQELCRSAGRSPSSVRIVAVSKTKPNEMVMQAYDADQRHFGENYVSGGERCWFQEKELTKNG